MDLNLIEGRTDDTVRLISFIRFLICLGVIFGYRIFLPKVYWRNILGPDVIEFLQSMECHQCGGTCAADYYYCPVCGAKAPGDRSELFREAQGRTLETYKADYCHQNHPMDDEEFRARTADSRVYCEACGRQIIVLIARSPKLKRRDLIRLGIA